MNPCRNDDHDDVNCVGVGVGGVVKTKKQKCNYLQPTLHEYIDERKRQHVLPMIHESFDST